MRLKLFIGIAGIFIMAACLVGCGSSSSTSECSCEICIDDAPAYPSDSSESCASFASDQNCGEFEFTTDPSETCGGEDQPVCQVIGCSGQCQCPDE